MTTSSKLSSRSGQLLKFPQSADTEEEELPKDGPKCPDRQSDHPPGHPVRSLGDNSLQTLLKVGTEVSPISRHWIGEKLPNKATLGPSVQTGGVITPPGHPTRSLGDKPAGSKLSSRSGQLSSLSVTRPPTNQPACDPLTSYPGFDSLIQVHLLGFESPWGGPLPPLQWGATSSQGRGVMEPTS